MSDEHPGTRGEELFETIDPKLNVFALANGVDLTKGVGFRRLEWFAEGLERGILIEAEAEGRFRIEAMSWRTGSDDLSGSSRVGGGLAPADLVALLPSAVDSANTL